VSRPRWGRVCLIGVNLILDLGADRGLVFHLCRQLQEKNGVSSNPFFLPVGERRPESCGHSVAPGI
jgi:hypothetical protein